MLRATVWTVGLFGAGTAICRAFPATWTEPIVLFVLGLALLYVSARSSRAARDAAVRPVRTVSPAAAVAPEPAPEAAPVAAAAASVQVEQPA